MKTILFLPLVIIGLLVRILLSVSTYHQDIGAITLSSHYIVNKGEWFSFYDRSGQDANKTIFNYQSLSYLIPATFYAPFSGFVSKTAQKYVNADWQKSYSGSTNLELLFYKLPMVFADILIFFILGVILRKSQHLKTAQLFWALNPVAIFVSSVIGQVDVFIALFLLLAILFQTKNKRYVALTFVALSALIKPVGLVLLPFFVLENKNDTKLKTILSSVGGLLFGLMVYLLGILPFLGSTAYRHYALFADQINKTVHAGVEISDGTIIPYFFIALTFIYFLFLEKKKNTLQSTVLILLSSLVFTNFHPQWLVWVMPLILLAQKDNWHFSLFFLASWLLVLFSFDRTLHLGSFINSKIYLPANLIASDIFIKMTLFGRAMLVSCFFWYFCKNNLNKNEKTT